MGSRIQILCSWYRAFEEVVASHTVLLSFFREGDFRLRFLVLAVVAVMGSAGDGSSFLSISNKWFLTSDRSRKGTAFVQC